MTAAFVPSTSVRILAPRKRSSVKRGTIPQPLYLGLYPSNDEFLALPISTIMPPSTANQNPETLLILAGVSVAFSVASLLLSYRTWRHQLNIEEELKGRMSNRKIAVVASPKEVNEEEEDAATNRQLRKALTDLQAELANNDATILELKTKVQQLDNNNGEEAKTEINTNEEISSSPPPNNNKNNNNNNPKRIRATLEDQILTNQGLMNVKPIGVIRSIYRLCVGTPRQGLLVPKARGQIELTLPTDAAMDCIQELETFSHIWILFVFHLNTLSKNQTVPPKIAPPALGGTTKVGLLATRSPHRFNPIGITLAKLDRIEIRDKRVVKSMRRNGVQANRVVLHISGLDLVDGTPVLDVKPYVPVYDSVLDTDAVRLPPWVSEGLATRRSVTISEAAKDNLQTILDTKPKALQFYGPHYNKKESQEQGLESILECITQVLAMDVRSSWQTKKARQGTYQAERAHRLKPTSTEKESNSSNCQQQPALTTTSCTQQLDNLLLEYTVMETSTARRAESEGSGAEDHVLVTAIQLLQK